MLQPAEHVQKITDTAHVLVPNVTILAVVNLTRMTEYAQFVLIILSGAYTLWRWRKDARKDK